MRVLIVLAALALVPSGCVTPEAPPEAESVDEGAVQPAAAAGPPPSTDASVDEVAPPRSFPFAMEGRTGTGACAPSGPYSCTGMSLEPSENTFSELEYAGVPHSAKVVLTWSAQTPATETMYISILAARSCGSYCIEVASEAYRAFVSGASPLTLDAGGLVVAANETLYLAVGAEQPTPYVPPVYYAYSVSQPFSIEGEVVATPVTR